MDDTYLLIVDYSQIMSLIGREKVLNDVQEK